MKRILLGLLLSAAVLPMIGAKQPLTEVERLERAVKRTPGEMDLWCALVEAQLVAGDTTGAEQNLSYSLKMAETACLYMQKAGIYAARQDIFGAARFAAYAVKAGQRPNEDSVIFYIDSLSSGGVMLCMKRLANEDRKNASLWHGLGQMCCLYGDTASALPYFETAFLLGDSTAGTMVTQIKASMAQTEVRELIAEIPYTYQDEQMELRCKLNGLSMRMVLDSTATQSSISGVETMFMLKNNYLTKEDIHENTAVVIKHLELTEAVRLENVRFKYVAGQEEPGILCLRDLERLGRVRINENKRVIEITR